MPFAELGLAAPLLKALADEAYATPTPIQKESIPHLIAGRDLLGCAQTGTGKTAAFALPILQRLSASQIIRRNGGRVLRALILSPTRELAAQIGDSFKNYGRHTSLKQTVIFGGVGQLHQVNAIKAGVDILVATPGRLVDLIEQGFVDLRTVETFVLDEADRMLDMGFLPDLRKIIARLPQRRQTVLFSATMPPEIVSLAESNLHDPVRINIAPVKATTELIEQSVVFISSKKKLDLFVEMYERMPVVRAIVFTRTKHGADRAARHLNRSGIRAESMHGNKSQNQRKKALERFKADRPPVLVATDVAARGLDVEGVTHVFNLDIPRDPESYVHRIGRTGRAGSTGFAISFCDGEEKPFLRAIEKLMKRQVPVDRSSGPEPADAEATATSEAGETSSNNRSPREGRGGNGSRRYMKPGGNSPSGKRRRNKFGPPAQNTAEGEFVSPRRARRAKEAIRKSEVRETSDGAFGQRRSNDPDGPKPMSREQRDTIARALGQSVGVDGEARRPKKTRYQPQGAAGQSQGKRRGKRPFGAGGQGQSSGRPGKRRPPARPSK